MKLYSVILSIIILLFCSLTNAQEEKVLIITNSVVYSDLKPEIFRYVDDISSEYKVALYETTGGTPEDLKDFINSHKDSLVGCILIGSMPVCWFEIENDLAAFHPTKFPCDLFFMDLDGSWSDDDNDGFYDTHTDGTGDVAPEIFLGRIDASLSSPNGINQIEDLRNYFLRDHNYWSGTYPLRKTGLAYTDVPWKNYSPVNEEMAYLYGINNYQLIKDDRISDKDYLENRLKNDQYEFIQIAVHSHSYNHEFELKGGVLPDDIRNVSPKALGYNLFACEACDYTQWNFMGGTYIFNNSEKSLVVVGSTKVGSMLQFYAFYQPLGENNPIGVAYKEWFEFLAPYDDSEKSWHYGMTILGDPLIKLNSGGNNHGPLANVGGNDLILWPDSTIELNAVVNDDGLPPGSILQYGWEEVSGSGNVSFDDPDSLSTSIHCNNLGNYRVKFTATDGEYTAEDFKNIKVSRIIWEGETNPLEGLQMGIVLRDNLAYVSTSDKLYIIDVSNKANPYVVSSYEFQESLADPYYTGLDADSNFAYVVLSEKGLVIINITDPSNPYEVATFRTYDALEKANAVKVIGDYAYVADNVKGLMVLNIQDRTNPGLVGYCPTDGPALGISIQDNYGYIADGSNGLRIIDISDKTHPEEIGSFNYSSLGNYYSKEGVQVLGNYAYVNYYNNDRGWCISIIDISDKTDPFEVTHLDGLFKGLHVEGNYLYYRYHTFYDYDLFGIYDITNKSEPTFIESYKMEDIYFQDVKNIYQYKQHIYILDNVMTNGLNIFKVHLDNTCPYVYAGEDQITCNGLISLEGMVSDDHLPDQSSLSFSWEKIEGPGEVYIDNPDTLNSQVIFSDSGSYVLRLSVNDGNLTGFDDVRIINTSKPPVSDDIEVCEGYSVPDLIATGNSIKWYRDVQLTDLVHSGDTFATGQTSAGSYIYYVTQSLSNCESQPDSVRLLIKPEPETPLTSNLEICEGDLNQSMPAPGENIIWYSDSGLNNILGTGNVYNPGLSDPGIYTFYVTQNVSGCESKPAKTQFTIQQIPASPEAKDTMVCEGNPVPDLYAIGEGIKWYNDPDLHDLAHSGNTFSTGQSQAGSYSYYVTQARDGCEGSSTEVLLEINALPVIQLGNDTVIMEDETLVLGPFPSEYNYQWNNGAEKHYMTIYGKEFGQGVHMVSVSVTGNGCVFNDTIWITVEGTIGLEHTGFGNTILIYPNPTDEDCYIEFSNQIPLDLLIEIYNPVGTLIDRYTRKDLPWDNSRAIMIHLNEKGIYYLLILGNGQTVERKVVRY